MIRKLLYPLIKHEPALRMLATCACLSNKTWLRKDGDTYLLQRGNRQIRISRQHLLYSMDTSKHFDEYFSEVPPEQKNGKLEVDYSKPRLHTLANGLQFELSSMPEQTSALDAYFRFHRPKPGDLVFDIGAYCGVFTRELSHIVGPTGRVIAFEPDPVNVGLLRRNVARHRLANVMVSESAVSDSTGTASFNPEGAQGSALSLALDRPSSQETTTVRTVTLEQACGEFGVPSFVKIDAEGSEIEILSGARDFLRSHPIHLVLDTDHIRNGKQTNGPVEQILRSCGYEVQSGLEGGFMTTWATPVRLNQ